MKERRNVTSEYRTMNTRDLLVDELYQRDIDSKRLLRMVKDYDPCLVNPVKVSFRDGKYYIYDGRHTAAMLQAVLGKGKDVNVDCRVFFGLTRFDEMELFVAQNGDSARVSINSKLRALYNFGDKDVVGMVQAAQCAGVRVDFGTSKAANKCSAVSTLMRTYMAMPREQFTDMLSVLREAWDGSPDGFSREILHGMSHFYLTYYGRFKPRDLIKSLSRISPVQIVREGKSIGAGHTNSSTYSRIILRIYNSGRTVNRLPDEL